MLLFQSFLCGLAGLILVQTSIVSAQASGQVFTQRSSTIVTSQSALFTHVGSMPAESANASRTVGSLRPPFIRSSHGFTLPSHSASISFGATTAPVNQHSERNSSSILTSNTREIGSTAGRKSSAPASGGASAQFATGIPSSLATWKSTLVQNVYTFAGIPLTGGISGVTASEGTIIPGGPPVTISSHVFSLGAAGNIIAVDGATSSLLHTTVTGGTPSVFSSPSDTSGLSRTTSAWPNQDPASAPVTTPVFQNSQHESRSSSSTSAGAVLSDTITSTDTIVPTDASTEGATNTAWTENLWLTTEKNGHQTVVPVIVGCAGCGGRGGGIILWNFPPIPEVSFRFPGFPELPTISFPCIPIPRIKKCSSPPSSNEGAHGGDSGQKAPEPSKSPDKTNSLSSETVSESTKTEASHITETSSVLSSRTTLSTTTSNATLSSTSSATTYACPLTSYSFSLAPGIDLFNLRTDTHPGSILPQTQSQLQSSSIPSASHDNSLPTTALASAAPIPLSKPSSSSKLLPTIGKHSSESIASSAGAFSVPTNSSETSAASFSAMSFSATTSLAVAASKSVMSSPAASLSATTPSTPASSSPAAHPSVFSSSTSASSSSTPASSSSTPASSSSISASSSSISESSSSTLASSFPKFTSLVIATSSPTVAFSTATASSPLIFNPFILSDPAASSTDAASSSPTDTTSSSSTNTASSSLTDTVSSSSIDTTSSSSTDSASSSTDPAWSAMISSSSVATSSTVPSSETAPPPTTAAPSQSSTPTVAPAIPPVPASCEPIPTTHVQDSHDYRLIPAVSAFCGFYASATSTVTINAQETAALTPGTNDAPAPFVENDNTDDVYAMSIEEVPDCLPDGGVIDPHEPVPGSMCFDILFDAWKQCPNQGRGGSIVAGCLVYAVRTVY